MTGRRRRRRRRRRFGWARNGEALSGVMRFGPRSTTNRLLRDTTRVEEALIYDVHSIVRLFLPRPSSSCTQIWGIFDPPLPPSARNGRGRHIWRPPKEEKMKTTECIQRTDDDQPRLSGDKANKRGTHARTRTHFHQSLSPEPRSGESELGVLGGFLAALASQKSGTRVFRHKWTTRRAAWDTPQNLNGLPGGYTC